MIIDKVSERRITAISMAIAFTAVHLCFLLLPGIFASWQEQTTDRILRLKFRIQPVYYDGKVVLVDLNTSSMQAMNNYYLDRRHHAQVVRNLAAMKPVAQMYDFIFAGPTAAEHDAQLIHSVGQAGNVYMGMAFRLIDSPGHNAAVLDADVSAYLERSKWHIQTLSGVNGFYIGSDPLITFEELARNCRGLGYLSLKPDRDGVFRRTPLLVRYGDGVYPSFSLQVVCDVLRVPPEKVIVRRGSITLSDAVLPDGRPPGDIVIPVDGRGAMRINYVGPWGTMHHYRFSDVYAAGDDPDVLAAWREELADKIVLVSDVSTGSSDVGQIPLDANYPLSGVHANTVYTILNRSFLMEPSLPAAILIELALLGLLTLVSFHRSAVAFTVGAFSLAVGYAAAAGAAVFYADTILPVISPLLVIVFGFLAIQVASAVANARTHAETEKARQIAEKELEIGRRIQTGFLPESLPAPRDWQIAAYFKPARQVAGDFYDVFELGQGRHIGLVIADVCDKGLGAAMFMAITRTMIRSFCNRYFDDICKPTAAGEACMNDCLLNTVDHTNNYIATTHGSANMFATVFIGILDTESGLLEYINCGHEPPLMVRRSNGNTRLKPTGPALGMLPDRDYRVEKTRMQSGDILFAFTDGVTEAQSEGGPIFGKDRLTEILSKPQTDAEDLLEQVVTAVNQHTAGSAQFDDLTLLAVKRRMTNSAF